jgi:ATP sulfurylase
LGGQEKVARPFATLFVLTLSPGCTHFIIGRDMAGCKSSLTGEDFYGAYDAQNTANE